MHYINKIRHEIETGLPGSEGQNLMAPEVRNLDEFLRKHNPPKKDSAVLILFFKEDDRHKFILIKRPEYDGPHSGQIAIPGGRYEKEDENLINTALREAKEEVGINPEEVEVMGSLSPLFIPVSGSQVLPVMGFIAHIPKLTPEINEVAEIIITDIETLVDPSIIKVERLYIGEREIDAPYFDIQGHHVWGATAMILSELKQIIIR
jgi:8-oxo-dGTP pyrophosphatase MutT (NUDIX family)